MLVSTNRTVVELVAVEAVACAEAADLALDLLLLGLEPGELCLAPGQRAQVLANERADRGASLGGSDPRVAVDVVWHGDRDVLHSPRLAQLHRFCESRNCLREEHARDRSGGWGVQIRFRSSPALLEPTQAVGEPRLLESLWEMDPTRGCRPIPGAQQPDPRPDGDDPARIRCGLQPDKTAAAISLRLPSERREAAREGREATGLAGRRPCDL